MNTPPELQVAGGLPIEMKPLAVRAGDLSPLAREVEAPAIPHSHTDVAQAQSPGFGAAAGLGAAFELKYLIDPDLAARIERWAAPRLLPDRHGDRGRYSVTSVYCDTPQLDVYHRTKGYRRAKFRLRRYDAAIQTFLERKRKTGTQVVKRRTSIHADELPLLGSDAWPTAWAGEWFLERIRKRDLRPTACVSYRRTAFFGTADESPVRMTIDRDLVGAAAAEWRIPHLNGEGTPLLPDGVLLEMKFHLHMPAIFRELLEMLPAQAGRVSKYRRCVGVCAIGGATASGAGGSPMGSA